MFSISSTTVASSFPAKSVWRLISTLLVAVVGIAKLINLAKYDNFNIRQTQKSEKSIYVCGGSLKSKEITATLVATEAVFASFLERIYRGHQFN